MLQGRKPVDVISVCNADGSIQPLRLRLGDGERGYFRMDITQVLDTKEIEYVGIESKWFLCRGRVENREHLFELKYYYRTHIWSIVRMIH